MKDHFNRKVFAAAGIVLLTLAFALFALQIIKILFLVFAAIVIAVFLSAVTDWLHKHVQKIPRTLFFWAF